MIEIEKYSHIWNGSEPGWVLIRTSKQEISLTLCFGSQGPSLSEVKAIRDLIPTFKNQPTSTVLKALRGLSELNIGTFDMKEGRDLFDLCRRNTLNIKAAGRDIGGDLLINEVTKVALVIEDETLYKAVCQAAIQHGLPIKNIEA